LDPRLRSVGRRCCGRKRSQDPISCFADLYPCWWIAASFWRALLSLWYCIVRPVYGHNSTKASLKGSSEDNVGTKRAKKCVLWAHSACYSLRHRQSKMVQRTLCRGATRFFSDNAHDFRWIHHIIETDHGKIVSRHSPTLYMTPLPKAD
jgi:hypothetical protein